MDSIESIFWNWPGLQQSCSCTQPLWLRWTIAGSLSVPFEVIRSNQHNFCTFRYQKLVTPVICCARNLLSQDVPLQGTCGRAQGVSQRNCVRRGRSKLNIHWGVGHESKKMLSTKNKKLLSYNWLWQPILVLSLWCWLTVQCCKLRCGKNTYYDNLCWCRKWRGRFFLFALFGKIRGSIVIKEFLQTWAGHIVIYHICPGKRMRLDRPQRISSNLML